MATPAHNQARSVQNIKYLGFVWTTEVKEFAKTHFNVLQAGGRRFEPCRVHQNIFFSIGLLGGLFECFLLQVEEIHVVFADKFHNIPAWLQLKD